jgi:hypothetical protein
MFHRSAEDAPPAMQSQRLGNFTLTSLVSSGALTTVHRARGSLAQGSENVEAEYAVKRLQPKYVNDRELRAALLASGQIGLKVSSPRVMRTLAVHEEPELFLVLEYLDGVSLQALLARPDSTSGTPEFARCAVPILVDVLSGLHALHSAGGREGTPTGWVHGAPCARHIMVMPDGTGRLTDLTHVVGPGLAWSPRRDAFLIADEMAPEQALAPAHIDQRCDLFIIGSVLWHVLTGKSLFAAEDADASLRSMLRMSIPAPSEVRATVGRALDGVCMRALQRPRQGRFASAPEMATALREKAEQAGLWASREEIAAWAKWGGEKPPAPVPGTALATRPTVIGLGFNEVQKQQVGGAVGFRPARPRRPQSEHGGQRPQIAAGLPSVRRPLVAAYPPPPEPLIAASTTTSGVTPTSESRDASSLKAEDSFVHRRAPELAALPWPETTHGRVQEVSPPWHEVQPSVAPPRDPQPSWTARLNKKAMAAGSAVAVVVLLAAFAIEDELGAPRRPPEMLRHSDRAQLPPAAVTQPPIAQAPSSPELAQPAEPAEPAQPAVQNSTLEGLMRATAGTADGAQPPVAAAQPPVTATPTPVQVEPPVKKRPSAPRFEPDMRAPAPSAPAAWDVGTSSPWEVVEKPKKRSAARTGEGESLPRNPY